MGIDGRLTTTEAAAKLGKTVRHVQWLITEDRLPAERVGRDYLIKESDLELVANLKRGRPSKGKCANSRTSRTEVSKKK